jgi:hypothetical protein
MPLFAPDQQTAAAAVAQLTYCNPFTVDRIETERLALGSSAESSDTRFWHLEDSQDLGNPNLAPLIAVASALADHGRAALAEAQSSAAEREQYADVVLFHLYHRYRDDFDQLIAKGRCKVAFYPAFKRDFDHYLGLQNLPEAFEAPHIFACFYQVRRAFHHIFYYILGGSRPAADLRAEVWQSIFTHDMRRYRRALYAQMRDFTTLITGPTGTGKELVARAIAFSAYLPFDVDTCQFDDIRDQFNSLNLSALSPNLIESELFGHSRGAFTGAHQEHVGWLEVCSAEGTVFLDEVGELDPLIQVKLLRVLQTRTFQRLGETREREFRGKIIAATNRNPTAEIAARRWRQDFYYRLCADTVSTPSLREQIDDSPAELHRLIRHLADHIVGATEGAALYCTMVYHRTGSYLETARRLGLDRRTVKAKIDSALLARLRGDDGDEPAG